MCNCGHSWASHSQGLKSPGGFGGGGGGGVDASSYLSSATAAAAVPVQVVVDNRDRCGSISSDGKPTTTTTRRNFAVRQDGLLAHLNDKQ